MTKTTTLIAVSALLSATPVWANDSNSMFEEVCATNEARIYTEVKAGQVVTVIPNAGNLMMIQSDISQINLARYASLFTKRFGISRDCAEYLLVNGKVEQHRYGDILAKVYFNFDQSTLTPTSKKILEKIVSVAKHSDSEFSLVGHTDSIGAEEYNFALGIKRAESVERYFNQKGISNAKVVSRGENAPVANNDTREGRALNRRVEVTL